MVIKFTKKEDLIAALEEKRAVMQDYDRGITAEHRQAEKNWMKQFRSLLTEARKWDYEQATTQRGRGNPLMRHFYDVPACPQLMEPQLDRLIAQLGKSRQQVFNISTGRGSRWSDVYNLLMFDPDPAPETPC